MAAAAQRPASLRSRVRQTPRPPARRGADAVKPGRRGIRELVGAMVALDGLVQEPAHEAAERLSGPSRDCTPITDGLRELIAGQDVAECVRADADAGNVGED
jgi:hypothetical protein